MDEMKEEDDDERGRKGEETKGVCLVFGVTVWTRRWLMGPAGFAYSFSEFVWIISFYFPF